MIYLQTVLSFSAWLGHSLVYKYGVAVGKYILKGKESMDDFLLYAILIPFIHTLIPTEPAKKD